MLVIGAGPIGLATAFWARRLGALRVAVTATSNRREALALAAGGATPRSMVTETVALSALPEAFESLRHRTTQCKTLVDAWES